MGSEIIMFSYRDKVKNLFGRPGTVLDCREYGWVFHPIKQYLIKWDDGEIEWVLAGELWEAK